MYDSWLSYILLLLINYHKYYCYAQLCLPWNLRNPSLWIPVSPVFCSLVMSCSPHEPIFLMSLLIHYSIHSLCCFACYFKLHPHTHYSTIINIYLNQICVIPHNFHESIKNGIPTPQTSCHQNSTIQFISSTTPPCKSTTINSEYFSYYHQSLHIGLSLWLQ